MFWNVVTWLKGIPSSSSHALVGGHDRRGRGACADCPAIQWVGLNKTLIAIVLSPMLGMILAMAIMLADELAVPPRRGARRRAQASARLHLVSSAAYSLSHGLNDAQKTMGDDHRAALFDRLSARGSSLCRTGWRSAATSRWALGTLTGGWKIIETMGIAHHQALAAPGIQRVARADRSSLFAAVVARHSGLDHAHHYRRDHRRGLGAARVGGALGRRAAMS